MKASTISLSLALGLLLGGYLVPAKPDVVEPYLEALKATMHEGTTHNDVEGVLSFYTEDVVYEHPRVGIRLEGKAAIREGMVRFMGAYAGSLEGVEIVVVDQISRQDMVVLELEVAFQAKNAEGVEEVRRSQVKVLEMEGDRISRVIDYW